MLGANSGIAAIVADRIGEGTLSYQESYPALVFTIISNVPIRGLVGQAKHFRARVQFDALAYALADADALSQAVFAFFDDFTGASGDLSILCARRLDDSDRPEPPVDETDEWLYRISSDYYVKYTIS